MEYLDKSYYMEYFFINSTTWNIHGIFFNKFYYMEYFDKSHYME